MAKEWIVFRHEGKELASISVDGLIAGEVLATKELLAYEKGIPVEEIRAFVETKSKA